MSSGTGLQNRILRAIGRLPWVRAFRVNTGMGWAGTVVERRGSRVVLEDARPLHAGLVVGGSDIIGLTTITITPEMVGRRVAVFTAVESKDGQGRLSSDQARFLKMVEERGGIAVVARSEEDALRAVGAGDLR